LRINSVKESKHEEDLQETLKKIELLLITEVSAAANESSPCKSNDHRGKAIAGYKQSCLNGVFKASKP
jgi:hypothetical protein